MFRDGKMNIIVTFKYHCECYRRRDSIRNIFRFKMSDEDFKLATGHVVTKRSTIDPHRLR